MRKFFLPLLLVFAIIQACRNSDPSSLNGHRNSSMLSVPHLSPALSGSPTISLSGTPTITVSPSGSPSPSPSPTPSPTPTPACHAQAGGITVKLGWDASNGATGYHVHWGTAPGEEYDIADAGNATEYDVSGLSGYRLYYFTVTAYNANGESGPSEEISWGQPLQGGFLCDIVYSDLGDMGHEVSFDYYHLAGDGYTVESSSDLVHWGGEGFGVDGTEDVGDGFEKVSLSQIFADDPARTFRVRKN